MPWHLDAAGHGGYALLLAGQLCIARGLRAGWFLRMAGELVWIVIGWALGSSSIVLWGLAALLVEAYGAAQSGQRTALRAAIVSLHETARRCALDGGRVYPSMWRRP